MYKKGCAIKQLPKKNYNFFSNIWMGFGYKTEKYIKTNSDHLLIFILSGLAINLYINLWKALKIFLCFFFLFH